MMDLSCQPGSARRLILTVFAILLSALDVRGAHGHIAIYSDEGATECTVELPALNETVRIYVVMDPYPGKSAVQFSLPMPACSPYDVAGWTLSPGYVSQGDLASGVQVAFVGCELDDIVVMSVDLVRTRDPQAACCRIKLGPHTTLGFSSSVEAFDCGGGGSPLPIDDYPARLSGDESCVQLPPPSDPFPADGATGVLLDVELGCTLHPAQYWCGPFPLGSDWVRIYLGTDANPPLVGNGGPFPFPTEMLAPATTYYWRVDYSYWSIGPISSPLWNFTTTAATAVETSTWGAIKALYR
ncbi:MAG TPA: hypothetical protein VEC56_07945 [Candidatus Krumholzibacteria bacterium]|nr:hypothetical protein [Candidatus Krumholzibacteria bacterium]